MMRDPAARARGMMSSRSKRPVYSDSMSNSDEYNENTPQGWSEIMYVVALYEVAGNENSAPV